MFKLSNQAKLQRPIYSAREGDIVVCNPGVKYQNQPILRAPYPFYPWLSQPVMHGYHYASRRIAHIVVQIM